MHQNTLQHHKSEAFVPLVAANGVSFEFGATDRTKLGVVRHRARLVITMVLLSALASGVLLPIRYAEGEGTESKAMELGDAVEQRLAAAKARWLEMSTDRRARIRERFQKWQSLPPEVRERVRRTFHRIAERSDHGVSDELASRLERFADDPIHRYRLRRLDRDFGFGLRYDRMFLSRLHGKSSEEKREIMREAHVRFMRAAMERVLREVGVDDQQMSALTELLHERVEAEASLMREVRQQRRELLDSATDRLAKIVGEDGEPAETARRLVGATLAPWRERRHRR